MYCIKIRKVFEILEEKNRGKTEEEKLIIGGDFNARIGSEGGPIKDDTDDINRRRSRDKIINKEGREMLRKMGEKGASEIDYVVANEISKEEIQEMRIGDRMEPDHLPLEVRVQGPVIGGGGKEKEKGKIVIICDWSKEGKNIIAKKLKEARNTRKQEKKNYGRS